jgi:hypothetical protein
MARHWIDGAWLESELVNIRASSEARADTYAELTSHRGWSPNHYENWLSDTLTMLLPPPPGTTRPAK